jgi:uncharacterized MAPEG superfamily protein
VTQDLTLLAWTLVLTLLQLGAAAIAKRQQEAPGWAAGPRDESPSYTGIAARLIRAQENLMETLPLFIGAVVIAHLAGREGSLSAWGTQLYFWGRLVYVPLYAFGIPYIRTVVWIVATVGLCLVLAACLLSA